ncbi:MAG: sulfatase-like hydrolase/transferase [Phycisphaerae bacterium]|nr:sulfatase-like hydrolase/transferase [Phycisphaerae bacterium]
MITLSMAVLVPLTSAVCLAATPEQPPRRPNIIVIVADDLGWNSVSYHGGPIRTPHIDRLARDGVAMDRFYVSPMCSPTRAGLMTGRYPMRFGMARSVVRPWMARGLPPEEQTLAEALAQAGYRHRGVFGKWHLGHLGPQWHPLSRGFTEFVGQYNGAADYWTRDRNGEIDWHVNATPQQPKGYTTHLITDAAADFIRKHAKEGPFFCYVPYTAPHDPLQAPDEYVARYAHLDDDPADGKPSDFQTLAAMITCMDDGIGKLLETVETAGIRDNTLVWFFSDNGGVRRFGDVNTPLREGKLTVYEGGVRVPAVVWWPGVIDGGRTIRAPMVNCDVAPTLLRAAGGKPATDKPLDGIDALDVLTGRADALPPRDLFMFNGQSGAEREQAAIIAADGWKLVVIGPDIRGPKGFETRRHVVELFHLADDPFEKHDLAAEHPQRVAELGRRLIAFRASEPADSMAPENRPPAGFKPPAQWRNAPIGQPAPAGPKRQNSQPETKEEQP